MLHVTAVGAVDLIWLMSFGGARKVGWQSYTAEPYIMPYPNTG
jgi:hypothetical protein